ncbi:MAG: ATP-binding cassette domain-containing protein [Alphaproteobacteria bacterium]|nr:ATP-binding cassette domain-containing protein [Alphaproteobacteria bacterium]
MTAQQHPLVALQNVSFEYNPRRSIMERFTHKGKSAKPNFAVDDVSLVVQDGECFALVGESGSGKSTIAKMLAGLLKPTSGHIHLDIAQANALGAVQMVFQNPYSSLNPRWHVGDIIAEPIIALSRRERTSVSPLEVTRRIDSLLALVGLASQDKQKYPHEFSGGQQQRIGIARALSTNPRLVICDEPTSALDVSIQAQVLNLLRDLQEQLGLTFFFISHNMATVRFMATQVGVMKDGQLVECASADDFFTAPQHPYSQHLLAAVPRV